MKNYSHRIAVLAIVLGGCFHPNAKTGAPCAAGNLACPDGQTCDTTQTPPVCVTAGGGGSADGGPADAPPDAAPQCLDDSACTMAAAPICDLATHTCRGCIADAECTGGVCIEAQGTCVPDAQVLFLDPAGTDFSTCSRARPCATFAHAFTQLTTTVHAIRIADGSYTEAVHLPSGTAGQVWLSGEDQDPAGATITSGSSAPVFLLDNDTNVLLEGVTVANGGGDGIQVRGQLLASRLLVRGNTFNGINLLGQNTSVLRVLDSRIDSNGQGILTKSGAVDLERTVIVGQGGGGVHTQGGPLTIVNCIVGNNGSVFSGYGGLRLDQIQGGATIAYDTIAYNKTAAGSTNAPGILANTPVTVTNMIIADNGTNGSAQYSSLVTPTHSLFEGGTAPQGMGNRAGPPAFVDETGNDFHIRPTSAAIDTAAAAGSVMVDVDGQARPFGAGPDMGADEYVP